MYANILYSDAALTEKKKVIRDIFRQRNKLKLSHF